MSSMKKEVAALKLQSFFRGYSGRKETNLYGSSQGKEIEIYLPFAVKKIGSQQFSYEDMLGGYKYIICSSDLFHIQMDFMNFGFKTLKIPEIVTVPFRSPDEENSNLRTEEEIDNAIGDFISLLAEFTTKAASQKKAVAFLSLNELIKMYNEKQPNHPLMLRSSLRTYLANPVRKELFTAKIAPVKKHQNVEICFVFEPDLLPRFDISSTPRTEKAAQIVENNTYCEGKLLMHIQKTYSLPIEKYNPQFLSIEKNPLLHNTRQQLDYLTEARNRSEQFVEKHPLPTNANRERILGLLTLCAEHVLTIVRSKNYKNLHEKADRPVLSIRHILHYVKINVCNKEERQWFMDRFYNDRQDIQAILCEHSYVPDFRGGNGGYGNINGFSEDERYDVIFDLFGDFTNGQNLTEEDIGNPLSVGEIKELEDYGMTSWKNIYSHHLSIEGRTHLKLQKVSNEFHALFEARRIGLMTLEEFQEGKSRIYFGDLLKEQTEVGLSL